MQQDAHEFLNMAFDQIESFIKNTEQRYILEDIF